MGLIGIDLTFIQTPYLYRWASATRNWQWKLAKILASHTDQMNLAGFIADLLASITAVGGGNVHFTSSEALQPFILIFNHVGKSSLINIEHIYVKKGDLYWGGQLA